MSTQGKRKRRGGRHFAQKQALAKEKERIARNRKSSSSPKVPESDKGQLPLRPEATSVPPVMLAPTGSPFTFVARSALDDPSEGQTLFSDYQVLPRLYETHEFDYVPPKAFHFEYPTQGHAEVAFLGRSNVGKSSLVNSLMRKDLCKTSKTPGRTQLPFYYGLFPKSRLKDKDVSIGHDLASVQGYLVDLPGYGFGTAPKDIVEDWQSKTQEWLIERREAGVLRRLFLLLDARRDEGPSELDKAVIEWAEEAEIPFSVVLTKTDRVSIPLVVKQVNELCMRYSREDALAEEGTYQSPIIHATSAQKKWGIHDLLTSIEAEFLGENDAEMYP